MSEAEAVYHLRPTSPGLQPGVTYSFIGLSVEEYSITMWSLRCMAAEGAGEQNRRDAEALHTHLVARGAVRESGGAS